MLLALGLMSPLCLCGDAVTESHTTTSKVSGCQLNHCHGGHQHEDGEDTDGPAPRHSHSHSDARLAVSGAVNLPLIPTFDLADWAVVIPTAEMRAVTAPLLEVAADEASPPRRCDAPVTGVFLV